MKPVFRRKPLSLLACFTVFMSSAAHANEFACDWRHPRQAVSPRLITNINPRIIPVKYQISYNDLPFVPCSNSRQMLGIDWGSPKQKHVLIDTLLCGDKRISTEGSSTSFAQIFTKDGVPVPAICPWGTCQSSELSTCYMDGATLRVTRVIDYLFVIGGDDYIPDNQKNKFIKKVISVFEYQTSSVTF